MEEKKLTTSSLVWIMVGGSIGTGLMTVTGAAAAQTGYSVWLAFSVAVVLGAVASWPIIFAAGTDTLNGAMYELNAKYLHPVAGAIYSIGLLPQILSQAAVALGIGMYLQIICERLPVRPIAIASILLFYILNVRGVNILVKIQQYMVYILLAGLIVFTICGFLNLNPAVLDVTGPEFFSHGFLGFAIGVNLLSFSTQNYFTLLSFSRYTKDAKRTMPRAMLIGACIIFVIYTVVTMAAAGGVGIDTFAGNTLGDVAKITMPGWLFYLFVFSSPMMALATTLNSNISSYAMIIQPAAENGWLPKPLAKWNRYNMPYVSQTLVILIILIPVLFGWDITFITANVTLFVNLGNIIQYFAVWRVPKKFPELWKESRFHMSPVKFNSMMILSLVVRMILLAASMASLSLTALIVNVVISVALIVYCIYRYHRLK